MKNLPKEKRDRIVLIVIGTIVVIVASWYGVINNQKKKLQASRQAFIDQQAKVENSNRLLMSKGAVAQRVTTSQQKLQAIEEGMATGDMYSWIILKVNKFRAGYNVDIPQFSREVTGEVGFLPKFPYKAATFNLRGSAHFHDFGRFIADFENSFPYIWVQDVELSPADSTSSSSTTTATSAEPSEKVSFRMELVTLINPIAR